VAKKAQHEPHANHERWLVSYADFITLLFAFFVVMYAISDLNSRKAKSLAQSVRFATHFSGSGGTEEPGVLRGTSINMKAQRAGGQVALLEQWVRQSSAVYEFLSKELPEDFSKNEDATKQIDERGVVLALPARKLFEPGTANATTEAETYIGKLVAAAAKFHNGVLIVGTTARIVMPEGSPYVHSIDLQLARLSELERIAIEKFHVPPDRVEIRSLSAKHAAGGYASAAQVDRAATIELIVAR